ncbi:MAG: hypothetical protein LBR95_03990, partial [Azoarcus sp.]|nr:hypothetical protein [Azoarcus sp.]
DGTLWHKEYDTEDRSDPNATGALRLIGCATRVNQRWVFCADFTGYVEFHDMEYEFGSYFDNGKLQEIHRINTGEKQ